MITDYTVIELIEAAGGGAELAHKMGFDRRKGRLRVAVWKCRGEIPADLKIAYAKLFHRLVKKHRGNSTAVIQGPRSGPAGMES